MTGKRPVATLGRWAEEMGDGCMHHGCRQGAEFVEVSLLQGADYRPAPLGGKVFDLDAGRP